MDNLSEFVGSLASKLKSGLGLKPNDLDELRSWSGRLEDALRESQDKTEGMKLEVGKIELRLRKKKTEMDAAHGMVKRMAEDEIEDLFEELDGKAAQWGILRRNRRALQKSKDKIREIELACSRTLTEEEIDGLAVKLEDSLEQLRQADGALQGFERVKYTPLGADREGRRDRDDGTTAEPSASERSASLAERLRRLEQAAGAADD